MHFDFLVIGQGLAGSLLSFELIKKGAKVAVIDAGAESASFVAAGMFNPLTGRKLSLSWKAPEFLASLHKTYTELEDMLGQKFYFPMPVIRLFAAEEDYEICRKNALVEYVKHFWEKPYMHGIQPAFGACEITGGGYIQTRIFLPAYRKFLKEDHFLLEEEFDINALKISEQNIEYKLITASKIIFCEGYKAVHNPFFNWLPFNLSKGDVVTFHAPGLKFENILNKGAYIIPLGNDLYRAGSTYKWNTLDETPLPDGLEDIKRELDKMINVAYEISEHKAGIRPTVKQRRPYLGLHPEHKNVAIFNGLGTKGVMLGPQLAKQMAEFLLEDKPLDTEVDISQYPYTAG